MKRVDLDQLPAKFDPPDRVPELVQRRRPDADAHHVGHDHHDGAADGWHRRQADLVMQYGFLEQTCLDFKRLQPNRIQLYLKL